ncbi:SDR family oxidoreductase [Kribbella capetownensis]|uniref:SDR family oxidoreductase n=1 Tax=Kribbella capetownensis TaxID=1572659 RepID=A0A4R0J7X4_9ACTN|nr:SDR family oxidoreductase [Kribbella capetownensis]
MLLENKVAVIYGGGGAVGGAVARAFARDGARIFLAGRTLSPLEAVAGDVSIAGGSVEVAGVDVLDADAVERHTARIVEQAGRLDISFNLIGYGDTQGAPLVETGRERFIGPVSTAMEAHFNTATAAGRHMIAAGSGVLLALTAQAGRLPYLNTGGFGVICAAIEGLWRQLAAELGPHGVRAVCLRSAGSPDTPGVEESWAQHAENEGVTKQEWWARMTEKTALRRLPMLADVANVAVLLASDHAAAITAEIANVTCGELYD